MAWARKPASVSSLQTHSLPSPAAHTRCRESPTRDKTCPGNCPTGSSSVWRRAGRNEGRPLCPSVPGPHQPLHVRTRAPRAPSGTSVGPPSARPTRALPCTHCSDMSVAITGRDQNSARVGDLILPSRDHSKAPSASAVPPGEGSPGEALPRSCSCPPATTPAVSMLEPSPPCNLPLMGTKGVVSPTGRSFRSHLEFPCFHGNMG